jgi:hypothetical protein
MIDYPLCSVHVTSVPLAPIHHDGHLQHPPRGCPPLLLTAGTYRDDGPPAPASRLAGGGTSSHNQTGLAPSSCPVGTHAPNHHGLVGPQHARWPPECLGTL